MDSIKKGSLRLSASKKKKPTVGGQSPLRVVPFSKSVSELNMSGLRASIADNWNQTLIEIKGQGSMDTVDAGT